MAIATYAEPRLAANGCEHLALESLGSGGGLTYRQCLECSGVHVTGGGRTWVLPRSA